MSFFEQNLAILLMRNPEVAAMMTEPVDCSHIEVVPSKQPGVLTAWVTSPSWPPAYSLPYPARPWRMRLHWVPCWYR